MKKKVAHFLHKYLSHSENLIYHLTNDLADFENGYFTRRLENLETYPTERIIVKPNESLYDEDLKRFNPQLIHAHYAGTGAAGLMFGFRFNLPLVISFYGDDSFCSFTNPPWPGYFRPLFQYGSAFLVFSQFMKEQLIKKGCPEGKISLFKLGVDLKRFKPLGQKPTLKKTHFLIVAPLIEKSGLSYAIEAFASLCKKIPQAELTIVGEGKLKTSILEQVWEFGLQQKVTLIPQSSPGGVLKQLQQADIFLHPQVAGAANDVERVPLAVIEASACGLPVIAANHSGLPEVVLHNKTGLLVPNGDVSALIDSMEKLLLSPTKATEMGEKGQRHVKKHHNNEEKRQELAELYQSLMKPRKKFYHFKKETEKSEKNLIIRSLPLVDFNHKLFFIKEQFPKAEIHVLTNLASLELCRSHPLVDEVVPFEGKRFSFFRGGGKLSKNMRNKKFKRIIVPFASLNGEGSRNVIGMAKRLGAKETLGLSKDNRWLKYSWGKLILSSLGRSFWSKAVNKIIIVTLASLAIIFLMITFVIIKIVSFFVKSKVED